MKFSYVKLAFILVLITIAVPLLFLPTPNSWVPLATSQNQQNKQIQNIPTPIILKTNTTQYVIITPPGWDNNTNLLQFAEWKTQKGIPTAIFNTTYINNNYTGRDLPEKIRNFLIDAYNHWNIQWVLLAGDTTLIPTRYFNIGSPDGLIPSDYYYAALNGTFDNNGDGNYGAFGSMDWIPELYVGRLPASNTNELGTMINKTLTYEEDLGNITGNWMQTAVFAGGEISSDIQGWRIESYIRDYVIPPELNMTFTSLFWDNNPPYYYNNLTEANFITAINDGSAIVNFCSHGSATAVSRDEYGTSYYTSTDAASSSNGYELPMVFASACETAQLDAGNSIGSAMLKNPNGGAVSYIGAARTSFGGDNINDLSDSLLDALFFGTLLKTNDGLFSQRPGYTLYQSKYQYYQDVGLTNLAQNYEYRQEFLDYNLLGDPELPIWTSTPQNMSIISESTPIPGKLMQISIQSNGGSPVNGALVSIQGTGYYHTYLTDSNGNIRIPAPQTGNYSIIVTKPNFLYNTTVLTVGTTTDQPTTFIINAPSKINPGDQFTINVCCSNPQGVISLELVVTDYHKVIVDSIPLLNGSYSFVIDSSYFNNNSMVFYASATDSQGYQTFSDAQSVSVQTPAVTPIILAITMIPTENSLFSLGTMLLLTPFLICAVVAVFIWPSKEQ
ncbi:MAG: C25 family cysteine peptidase [Candidatus Freyarchaeum deiterrae]